MDLDSFLVSLYVLVDDWWKLGTRQTQMLQQALFPYAEAL